MAEYGRIHTDGSRSGGQPIQSDVERVARALAQADRIEICSDATYALSSYGHKAQAALAAMRQPTQSDALQADIDAMESILWVDTIIDDKEAIAKAFARHRQYGYDQGYYDGQRDRQLRQENALREALEAAPLIGRTESVYDFMERQSAWLNGPYRAAMQEQSK